MNDLWPKAPWARYALALAALGIAVGVRLLFQPLLGDRLPFLTLLVIVLFTARFLGRGPALLVLLLGVLFAALFLFRSQDVFSREDSRYQFGLVVFILVGLGCIFLVQSLHHAETAERMQRECLETTLNSIGDGVIAVDGRGRVTMMNPVAQSLSGWTEEEAKGQPVEEVLPIIREATGQPIEHPAIQAIREKRKVSATGQPALRVRDGASIPIEATAGPVHDRGQSGFGSVLVFRENKEQREAVKRLAASEHQFRTLADSIPQLAWITRPDGQIEWYNRRWYEYTGTTLEQVKGWGWQSVHDPQELPRVMKRWKAALDAGTPWEDIFPLRRADGQMRWHLSRAVPVRNEQGTLVSWFGTNTDITERMQFEQDLERAARRKDEFMATLAHELRNPLSALQNGLEIQRLRGLGSPELEDAREIMVRQVQQMIRLVDDLMDLSRMRRYKLRMKRSSVDVGEAVRAAVTTCQPLIDEARHTLNLNLPKTPLIVNADLGRLSQVFINLLNNAAKYTKPGGQIDVTLSREGSDCVVSVQDTGVGISADQLPRIFELFLQLDDSLEQSRGGLGIGLSLVRSLVELQGGSVVAHSDGVGKGSEFVVRLPLVLGSAPALPATDSKGPEGARGGRGRILVVDDNPDASMSLSILLEGRGFEVRTETDGLEALRVAESFRPDAAVLDIGLPRLNGYALAQKIRELPGGEEILLIAATGWGQEDDRVRSREAGFDHHLVKPIDLLDLLKLLGSTPARRTV